MKVISQATAEPIDIATARKQCKVDADQPDDKGGFVSEDDDLIMMYVGAAREWCEAHMGVTIAPATVETTLDAFPASATANGVTTGGAITLEAAPVLAVLAITYLDEDGMDQVVDQGVYVLDATGSGLPVVRCQAGQIWPTTDGSVENVKIDYVVGYSDPTQSPTPVALPYSIKVGILLLTAHLYKNRESTVEQALAEMPMGVRFFLGPKKIRRGFA